MKETLNTLAITGENFRLECQVERRIPGRHEDYFHRLD